MTADSRKIRVAVRVRPFNEREMEHNPRNIIKVLDKSTLMFDPDEDEDEFFFHGVKQTHRDITKRVKKKLTMEYDDVFDNTATNNDIFEVCMKPLVQSVMNGYNCSVFVYGATGAGKTHTMLGNTDCPGITFLTMKELFRQIESLSELRKFDIGISYLEVYNELVMNLLTKSGPLKLREDSNGVVVSGLVLKQIHNATELLELLALGNRNRTQHPTDANAESSRSHAIFQVHIRMVEKKTGQKRTVKLSMIDLAGSERAASTKGLGIRFKEGANINKSLLALGNCINKLADGLKHIPYRDSNLTRILKDSLGGNCQTVMIANISPSSLTYDDTYNTLKYASRAKKIRTIVRQNIVPSNVPKEFLIKKVNEQADEIERLKSKLADLEEQLRKKTQAIAAAESSSSPALNETLLNTWISRIDSCYASMREALERLIALKSKEKLINMRVKLKEQAETIARVVTLDGSHLNEDIAKLEATIDRYGKQVANQQADTSRWKERLRHARRHRNALREEVLQCELAPVLKGYLSGKEAEIEALTATLWKDHVLQMSFTYDQENKLWQNIMMLSGDIIQQNYLLLRSMDRLDNATLDKLKRLVKLNQRQRGVTFFDDDCQQDHRNDIDLSSNSLDDIANLSDCCSDDAIDFPPDNAIASSTLTSVGGGANKRAKLNDGSESDTEPYSTAQESEVESNSGVGRNVFKKPKTVGRAFSFKATTAGGATARPTVSRRTPTKPTKAAGTAGIGTLASQRLKVPRLVVSNVAGGGGGETNAPVRKKMVLPGASGQDENKSDTSDESNGIGNIANSTFDIASVKDSQTESLFSKVLVESNVDPLVLDKVLRRASMKGGKMALSVSKDNRKKSPKRIGKSPRSVNRTNNRTNASASSVINRYRMMKAKDAAGSSSGGSSGSSSATITKPLPSVMRTANNNFESDSDRNRHNRLMGIIKK
ncbi:kinesin-like protein KIF18A [Anopheles maculipalpis]|uniref:kinesin-like protein KIF18A n=1 Tax=Anopheles maculipalpis TaxID=1496333 RepID=UPI002159A481|nr:kinesin-like protein KIF18A [Anopheles maculipalpis]